MSISVIKSWKYLLSQIEKKYLLTEKILLEHDPSQKEKLSQLKSEVELLVDDFLKQSNKIKIDSSFDLGIVENTILSEKRIQELKILVTSVNESIKPFLIYICNLDVNQENTWIHLILEKYLGKFEISNKLFWNEITHVNQIDFLIRPDVNNLININGVRVKGGVDYDPFNRIWNVDFILFHFLDKRFKSDIKMVADATILFIIHEALHKSMHNLDRSTVSGIGDYARVIEDADYQADVYAILNLLSFLLSNGKIEDSSTNVSKYMNYLLNLALETSFAFTMMEYSTPLKSIQIRRLNRVIIWAYQILRLEKISEKNKIEHLGNIIDSLFNKPLIDISGLDIFSFEERIHFKLDLNFYNRIKLSMFYRNRIKRNSPIGKENQKNLLEGIMELRISQILDGLRSYTKAIEGM